MVKHILNSHNSQLSRLIRQAQQLAKLATLIKNVLDPSLQPHIQVGNLERGVLSLVADNAAWATQLRFQLPDLRNQLRKNGLYNLSNIRCSVRKTQPITMPSPKKSKKSRQNTSQPHAEPDALAQALARLETRLHKGQ